MDLRWINVVHPHRKKKNEVLSTSSAPGILERVLGGLRGVLEALDHLGSSWTDVNLLLK